MWAGWLGGLALATAALIPVRASLGAAHVVLAYLLLVLGASARGGRAVGFTLAFLAFGCFNFFFVSPYHTFAVAEPLDYLVLGAFLATSVIAAQLLARAQGEAAEAGRRAAEVDRLAALGAEALNAGRAEEALGAVADVIRTSVDVTRCEVHLRDEARGTVVLAASSGPATAMAPTGAADARLDHALGSGASTGDEGAAWNGRAPGLPEAARLVTWVADTGRPAAGRADGALRFGDVGALAETFAEAPQPVGSPAAFDATGACTLLLPLRVRDRTVGVLVLVHEAGIVLNAPRRRLLGALAYYAALGAERVRLEAEAGHAEALRQADVLKDALLASVSHDLRTPLTTIKALAHQIGADGDERAVTIEEEADRLNRFVADLLDLSRLAGGALTVTPELNTADDLLGAALQRVAGAAGDRLIAVALDPAEPLLVGRFDFAHALRILVNLLENALKYAPDDAPIALSARRTDGTDRTDRTDGTDGVPAWLEVVVADGGPGVSPAERERIFAPFYRPVGSAPDAGSAGLGLSISRRLAEAQGGTLHCEPRAGGGSRFVLRLPGADLTDVADLPLA